MAHLSLSQGFLVPVPKLAVSLQPAFSLSPLFSPPPQHLASLQPTIILALTMRQIAACCNLQAGVCMGSISPCLTLKLLYLEGTVTWYFVTTIEFE